MLTHVTEWLPDYFLSHGWIIRIFSVVFFTMLVHAISSRVFTRLKVQSTKTQTYWDNALIDALNTPLSALIWLLGICIAGEIARSHNHGPSLLDYIPILRKLGVVLLLTWFAIRSIRELEKNYLLHAQRLQKTVDKTLIHASAQLIIISIVITAALVGMQLFGLPISGLLAFGGIGGAGIAFASKDLLANFFGGLVIYTDRPFKVGDWIRSPDKQIEGTVEHIGWRVTRIRTFDKRPLYVPNGAFLTITVENPSRMTNRRIKTIIGIRYDDSQKIANIIDDVKAMLSSHPAIDTKQTLIVNVVEFGASSINFMVYTFTKTTNWVLFQEVQQDVFLKILSVIESHNAECAFPTQTLHIPNGLEIKQEN